MNEIDNLTGPEKSMLLAKAMGWQIRNSDRIDGLQFIYDADEVQVHVTRDARFLPDDPFNLYAPAHMALAFRTFYWFYHDTRLSKLLRDQWNIDNLMGNPVDKIVPILLDNILTLIYRRYYGAYYQMLKAATHVKHPILREIEAAISLTTETK